MVNPDHARRMGEPVEITPSRAQGWFVVGFGVLLVVGAVPAPPLGRLLLVPAALLLIAMGARDLLLAPTLVADAGGLIVVDGLRRRTVAWGELDRVRVVTDRRTPLLELDLGDTVVVLSRRRLGIPPYLALEQLERARAAQPPA
jgi:hypothetical protein